MNFRYLFFMALLGLSACNGTDSPAPPSNEGTFVPPAAIVNTGGTKDTVDTGGTIVVEPKPTAQQIARTKANNLKAQAKIKEAALVLKEAGLITEAAETFKAGGLDEEAYKLYAPEDYVLEDKTAYDGEPGASLAAAVDERPSVMRHKMTLNGKTLWYTAAAGHLTAYAKNPQKEDPQASIFYTAYSATISRRKTVRSPSSSMADPAPRRSICTWPPLHPSG